MANNNNTTTAVYATNPDAGTTIQLVNCCELEAVEVAVDALSKHHVLGLDWSGGGEEYDGTYQPIKLLIITGGDYTFIFDVVIPGHLPVSLRLLLTHNEYVKVIYGGEDNGGQELTVGRFWRDFGFVHRPTFDVQETITNSYSTSFTLYQAFRRKFKHAKASEALYLESLRPREEDLEQPKKKRTFAFIAWAARECWISLAKPNGSPPNIKCRGSPINVSDLTTELTCEFCGARMHCAAALRAHVESDHTYRCPCCRFEAHREEQVQVHCDEKHFRCPVCDVWVADSIALGHHHRKYHNHVCPVSKCGKRFANDTELVQHLRSHHKQCKVCEKWFLDADRLMIHQETTHPTCSYCKAQFHSEKALQKHRYARVGGICVKVVDVVANVSSMSLTQPHLNSTAFGFDDSHASLSNSASLSRTANTSHRLNRSSYTWSPGKSLSESMMRSGVHDIPGKSTHVQDLVGEVRWVEPPRSPHGKLMISRKADKVGEVPL